MKIQPLLSLLLLCALGCVSDGIPRAERLVGCSMELEARPATESDLSPLWHLFHKEAACDYVGDRYCLRIMVAELDVSGRINPLAHPTVLLKYNETADIAIGPQPYTGFLTERRWWQRSATNDVAFLMMVNQVTGTVHVTLFQTNHAVTAIAEASLLKVPRGDRWSGRASMTVRPTEQKGTIEPADPRDGAPAAGGP